MAGYSVISIDYGIAPRRITSPTVRNLSAFSTSWAHLHSVPPFSRILIFSLSQRGQNRWNWLDWI